MMWPNLIVSVLILLVGFSQAYVLSWIDQDLRVLYTDYTLAVIDLGHLNTELSRYRTTVLRAVESKTERDFQRVVESIPAQRRHIETTVDRFVTVLDRATVDKLHRKEELTELGEVRGKLASYLTASDHTVGLLHHLWSTPSQDKASHIRGQAEQYAAKDAGGKFINITLALDQLIKTVSNIAADIRTDGDKMLRILTAATVAFSILLIIAVIWPAST
jgi:Mg2+ and Co2+ transporter CorA